MSEKPQRKRKIGILKIGDADSHRYIEFNAPKELADQFREFGQLGYLYNNQEHWNLTVDARYDFKEVVEYIKDYE